MSRAHRFAALDAWRGICALLVALEHLNTTSVIHKNALVYHSYRFVDFFFVLSGFVIAHAYGERMQRDRAEVRPFLIRRVGRLWPLHVTMLAVLVVVEFGIAFAARHGISIGHQAFTDRNTVVGLAPNLVLVHGWGMFDRLTWNTPSWSISAEMFAYLLFAAICAWVPARRVLGACAAFLIAGAVIVIAIAPEGMQSTFDFGLARCVYGFMFGVLVRALWSRRAPKLGTLGEVVVLGAVFAAVALLPLDWPGVFTTAVFAVAVWVFASEDGAISRALTRKIPQALGAWSYSIYMVHVVIALGILTGSMLATKHGWHLFARVDDIATITGSQAVTGALTVAYVGMVILLSSLTYRYVELPGQRWFGRYAPRPAAQAAATA